MRSVWFDQKISWYHGDGTFVIGRPITIITVTTVVFWSPVVFGWWALSICHRWPGPERKVTDPTRWVQKPVLNGVIAPIRWVPRLPTYFQAFLGAWSAFSSTKFPQGRRSEHPEMNPLIPRMYQVPATRNPAFTHQLRLVVDLPLVTRFIHIPGGAGFLPSTVSHCLYMWCIPTKLEMKRMEKPQTKCHDITYVEWIFL